MHINKDTLDDLLREVLERILNEEQSLQASRGNFKELFGCCLHLTNPRARLSRSEGKGKIFSALGEFFWYLSGDTKLDFIDYYIPRRFQEESCDQIRVRSGYGERLSSFRGMNQIANIINLLQKRPTSRRAVIQLFDATDLEKEYKSIPCTCTIQVLARDGNLHMFVSMRSNDAYIGLPHDVFAFTMLQEIIARSTGLEIGEYKHFIGSLHLYENNFDSAKKYLDEGFQSTIAMPSMPDGDPWDSIRKLQKVEEVFRSGKETDRQQMNLEELYIEKYWKDLARLLIAFRASKEKNTTVLASLMNEMDSDVYKMFIQARIDNLNLMDEREKSAGNPR